MNASRFPYPLERFHTSDAGVIGLRADLATIPSRELLDQYAALAMLPDAMRDASALRLALIRDILLSRLDGAA